MSYNSLLLSGVNHNFHTRQGGVSTGYFASMNLASNKGDAIENVQVNRQILLGKIACEHILDVNQVHGNTVHVVTTPWEFLSPLTPYADAIVSQLPGIAIGIVTADCVPVLIHDPITATIAAVHSGWRGTLSGVITNTVKTLQSLGCEPANLKCAIGPCIQQDKYEVSHQLFEEFPQDNRQFFQPAPRANHYMFDLPGVVEHQLRTLGITQVENLKICTYSDQENFFSCRRSNHQGEPSFGCQISTISL